MTSKKGPKIPPPPGPEASTEEIIAYYTKYDFLEIQKAGYYCDFEEVPPDDPILKEFARVFRRARKSRQLTLIFSHAEMEKLKAYAEKVKIPLRDLAKQWILEGYEKELKCETDST